MAATAVTKIELKTEGGEKVILDLNRIGKAGDEAFRKLQDSSRKVSPHLKAVDAAVADLTTRVTSAGRGFGPLSAALSALGPGGLVAGAAVAGVAAIGIGLAALTRKALENADALDDQATAIGISVEKLQLMQAVASQVGVGQEQLGVALRKFTANVGAARLGTGSLVETLKKVDPAFLQTVRSAGSMDAALDLVLRRLGDMPDHATRAALAVAAFGKSGATLLPIVKDGAAGLEQFKRQALALGLVIDAQLVREAGEANDKLELVARVIKTNLARAVLEATPLVTTLATSFLELTRNAVGFFERLGVLEATPTKKLEDIKRIVHEIKAEMAAGGPQLLGGPARLKQLEDEARRLRGIIAAAERARRKEQEAADKAAKKSKDDADAEAAREAASKKFAAERKSALGELERAEESATTAGLEGIAKVEAERDRALAHFKELEQQKVLTAEEAARAYAAIWKQAEGERALIVEKEDEKRRLEQRRLAEAAAAEAAKPFLHARDEIQDTFSNTIAAIVEDGKLQFADLGKAIEHIFIQAAADIAAAFVTQQLVDPILRSLGVALPKGVNALEGGSNAGTMTGSGGVGFGLVSNAVDYLTKAAGSTNLGGQLGSLGEVVGLLGGIYGLATSRGTLGRGLSAASVLNSGLNLAGGYGLGVVGQGGGLVLRGGGVPLLSYGANGFGLGAAGLAAAGYAPLGSAVSPLTGTVVAGMSSVEGATVAVDTGLQAGAASSGASAGATAALNAAWIIAAVVRGIQVFMGETKWRNQDHADTDLPPSAATVNNLSLATQVQELAKRGARGKVNAAFKIIDPVTVYLLGLSDSLGGSNFLNLRPTQAEALRYTQANVAKQFNTTTRTSLFGAAATGAERRALAGTDADYLAGLIARQLGHQLTHSPGLPAIGLGGSSEATVRSLIRGTLRGGLADAADPERMAQKLLREFVGFGPALATVNRDFLEHGSVVLRSGKSLEDFAARVTTVARAFERQFAPGADLARVALKVLADQGFATVHALQRAAFIDSRNAAEDSGDLTIAPRTASAPERRVRKALGRRRVRLAVGAADDSLFAAQDALERQIAGAGYGGAGLTQSFGNLQTAVDAFNTLPVTRQGLRQLPDVMQKVEEATASWGQQLLGLIDQLRTLRTATADTDVALRVEAAGLRKSTNTADLYNDLIGKNAAQFDRLSQGGGSAGAQVAVINRQLDLLRTQAGAQLHDLQARSDLLAPLAGLAPGVRDQIAGITLAGKSTPGAQLDELARLIGLERGRFRGATGAAKAAAGQRLQALVGQQLELAGNTLGGTALDTLRRGGLATLGEVADAAGKAEDTQEQIKAAMDDVNTTLADQLDLWRERLIPLMEAQADDVQKSLGKYLTPEELAAAVDDPQAAQMIVAGKQLSVLQEIAAHLSDIKNNRHPTRLLTPGSGSVLEPTDDAPLDPTTERWKRTRGGGLRKTG